LPNNEKVLLEIFYRKVSIARMNWKESIIGRALTIVAYVASIQNA